MSRSCLVHVYGNSSVLSALCAVKWYGLQRHGSERANVVTLVHNPGLSDALTNQSGAIVERLTASQGWSKPVVLTAGEMAGIIRAGRLTTYRAVLRRFREKISVDHFDEIYYSHDLSGRVVELVMNAYPDAVRITFGDGLGQIYDRRYLTLAGGTQQGGQTFSPRHVLNVLKTRIRLGLLGGPRFLQASKAVLTLPMDHAGDILDDKELFVIPKKLVLEIISDCNRENPELEQYSQGLLSSTPALRFLVLLSNLSDGHFTSIEREVAMYEEMVRHHAPQGAAVFIKVHPLSVAPLDEMLRSRLQADYTVQTVSREFNRYPIELWSGLISACQVITITSCVVSLSFLYDRPVIYPVGSSWVERYILPPFWDYFKDGDRLYRGQLANLPTWDGRSVLWRGSGS